MKSKTVLKFALVAGLLILAGCGGSEESAGPPGKGGKGGYGHTPVFNLHAKVTVGSIGFASASSN